MNDSNVQHPPRVTVDVHSHILPQIDDGSGSLEETVKLLRASYRQGVRHMWATPHFYPRHDTPADFLARRDAAAARVAEVWDETCMPSLYLGAEVAFFDGINQSESMEKLCLAGTKYLLVEMPAGEWAGAEVDALLTMRYFTGLWPIIAHIERCLPFQSSRVIRKLASEGILFQSNASFLGNPDNKRKIKSLIKNDALDLIATDCHNMTTRQPNLMDGLAGLHEMFGAELISNLESRARELTSRAVPFCAPDAE